MYALCSDAMLKAITRQARAVDAKVSTHNAALTSAGKLPISTAYFFDHLATDEDTAVMVTEDDFLEAERELVPSVSAEELQHYERVRRQFEGAGKKEGADAAQPQGQSQLQEIQGKLALTNGTHGPQLTIDMSGAGNGSGSVQGKGKGKGKANNNASAPQTQIYIDEKPPSDDEDDYVIRTERLDINGTESGAAGSGGSGAKGKGKGKGKSSVDIAEGGFGEAAMDDDLYE